MAEFFKHGDRIVPKPNGADYDLLPGKVYDLKEPPFSNDLYLTENGDLNLNFKIYNSDEDKMFMKRVLKYHHTSTKQSTGVLLNGLKGTGKTVMAKQIARDSGLPIIVVDPGVDSRNIEPFFTKFKQDVVIIFDEVEKNWNTQKLLGFLDGVQATAKKLVLFTSNSDSDISDFLKDRCSRIRYVRTFAANENVKFLKEIIKDKGIEDKDDKLFKFMVNNFKVLSMDNIISFIEEVTNFPELSSDYEALAEDMNIQLKKKKSKKIDLSQFTMDPDLSSEDDDEDYDDDDDDDEEEESYHLHHLKQMIENGEISLQKAA